MTNCPRDYHCGAENVAVVECIWCDQFWCSQCRDDIPHGGCCVDVPVNPHCTLCNRSGPGKYYANRMHDDARLTVFCQACYDEYVRDLELKEFCG